MNLVADFGNTRIKAALFEKNEMLSSRTYSATEELIADEAFYKESSAAFICSVTSKHEELLVSLSKKMRTLLFSSETRLPVKNRYRSVSTLGSDRLAACVGAFLLYPNCNVLTIDAGTCIKYNFMNQANEFLGGAISPGIPMRLKAMHHFTSRLPLVEPDPNYDKLTGNDTAESLLSGALTAAAAEADGMIARYAAAHPDLQVVLTGGDAGYLSKQLKSRFFAHPALLLHGLNGILNYNIES